MAAAINGGITLGLSNVEDFASVSKDELRNLHGVGSKAISVIEDALAKHGLVLQSWTQGKTVLTDPQVIPDDSILAQHLSGAKPLFDQMIEWFGNNNPPLSLEWRYYTDGNSWLGKVTAKQNTIIWVTVCHHMFRGTFYFKKGAVPLIERSGLDEQYRPQWEEIVRTGKTKAVSVEVDSPEKLEHVRVLAEIKLSTN